MATGIPLEEISDSILRMQVKLIRSLKAVDPAAAQSSLARRWLRRFGPATVEDLQWWTGWNKTTTRAALARLDVEEVDLHGQPDIDLRDSRTSHVRRTSRLPPTVPRPPDAWKHRDWFTAVNPALIYDQAGNISSAHAPAEVRRP